VRIDLHGRRVRGWVVAEGAGSDKAVDLKPIAKISPGFVAPDLVELSVWAAWRWAGKRRAFLNTASEFRSVHDVPRAAPPVAARTTWATDAVSRERSVLRLAPAVDPWPVVETAAERGPTLVLVPSLSRVERMQRRLAHNGIRNVVVGARAGAWAPCPALAAVVVIDAHDEVYAEERAPTWNAWRVAAERARRAGAPCVLVSAAPTLEHLAWGDLVETDRATERSGWARTEIVDRRGDDPRKGLWSDRAVAIARGEGRVVCVLNRTGRAKLLACATCATVATCERCAGVVQLPADLLVCARCGTTRPQVCTNCGGSKLKQLRIGTTRAAEELRALLGEPVGEVTGASDQTPSDRVLVGTEALLHRVGRADAVVFVDLDAELAAPHYRANEASLALLARASRLVRGRTESGVVVVQTRQPEHPVLRAVTAIEPALVAEADREMREALGLPPFAAMAHLSADGADAFADSLRGRLGVTVRGPDDRGAYLVLAADHQRLCDALASVDRPNERVRIAVDPMRI
jgi:primosomal protein N' (replication factor Y)